MYGVSLGGVYALASLGFTLIFGVLRLLHVSYGDVMMFSGYIVLSLLLAAPRTPVPVLLLAGMLAAAAIGLLVERVAFRPYQKTHHIMPLIGGIGVVLALQNTEMLVWGPAQKAFPFPWDPGALVLGGLRISGLRLAILALSLILMFALNLFLFRTRAGLAVRATAIDPEAACLMGISPNGMTILTFAVGSALAGAGSVLIGGLYGSIYPSLGFSLGLKAFIASVVGGLGSLSGALAGGLLLGLLEVMTAGYVNVAYRDGVAMLVLLAVMVLRPSGLLGRPVEEKV